MIVAVSLALLIAAGYGLALWWLLRGERGAVLAGLVALASLALALRLVLTGGYPWGLVEDEPKFLACASEAVARGELAHESCIHIPYFVNAVFAVPLASIVGATRWAIRSYTLLASVLAVPALYGAARAIGLRPAGGLVAAGLVAVLPWSLYYGRVTLGGELILHQALLIAGLAGLVWRHGGWREALLGGFGLCLLLWDYWAGRAMVALPLGAALLAGGRRRLWCLAVLALALLGWSPHLATGPRDAHVGLSLAAPGAASAAGALHPGYRSAFWETLQTRGVLALHTFVAPVAEDNILTLRPLARHPPLVLALAALGLLTGVRRGLFLLGGFAAGLAPGIASGSFGISAHRIILAYPFVALAAGAAIGALPRPRLRAAAAAGLLVAATAWSVSQYFSEAFWASEDRYNQNAELTALAETLALRRPSRLIFMSQLGFHHSVSGARPDDALLTADNWLPADGAAVTYAFTWQARALRAPYERLLPGRVVVIGRDSFLVELEAADWSWLRRAGWRLTARCGDTVRHVQVPFLYHREIGLALRCSGPVTWRWRGHWHGPRQPMLLRGSGVLTVEARALSLRGAGFQQELPFTLPADTDVTITLTTGPESAPDLQLYELTPGGRRVPDWERVTPLDDAAAAMAALPNK